MLTVEKAYLMLQIIWLASVISRLVCNYLFSFPQQVNFQGRFKENKRYEKKAEALENASYLVFLVFCIQKQYRNVHMYELANRVS